MNLGDDPTPAIVRHYSQEDRDVDVRSTPYDSVTHQRGLGDSGYKLQVVNHDCPHEYCSFDRMIRQWRTYPEERSTVAYWCLSPNCPHYVDDEFGYAMQATNAQDPTINEYNQE
jgi:hypothetical protein